MKSEPILARFLKFVSPEPTSGCWLWTGCANKLGYGAFRMSGDRVLHAYQTAYVLLRGPVPEGLELDHLCRVPNCVNPDHLEPVTHLENMRRGLLHKVSGDRNRNKTHCPFGHPYDAANTKRYLNRKTGRLDRYCRACYGRRNKIYLARQKQGALTK